MNLHECTKTDATLDTLRNCGLLAVSEFEAVHRLGASDSPFANEVALAETIHLHIKVEDTHALPINQFFDAGARLDHQKDGFVKYRFPGAINAIFSHIKVSQDELLETETNRRPRPFLDHIGIDLREESDPVRQAFDALPGTANNLDWSLASQGGPDQPVYCCHVEVAAKHWIYPPDEDGGHSSIPLEFAYGALKVNPDKSGCDLRPADPAKVDAASIPSCCGTPANIQFQDSPSDVTATGYYQWDDLARFGEIARVNPALGEAFFSYYQKVMAEGVLTKREKALIALALAHALKCPYCIDAYSGTLQSLYVSEEEMNEAVHVAGAIGAGITLVHSVQMMNKLDQSPVAAAAAILQDHSLGCERLAQVQ